MDDFDSDPRIEDYDDPTSDVAVAEAPVAAKSSAVSVFVPVTPAPVADAVVPVPSAPASAPASALSKEAIPGVELRRGADEAMAAIDTMALAELLQPSRLTDYLSRTVGEHQAVVDVDAAPGVAIKQMMRQSLLLLLANQKIMGKSAAVAVNLEQLEPRLESYVFGGDKSVLGRLQTSIDTIAPATRKILEEVLTDADRLIVKLVRQHVDAAVDGHELVERRREVTQLTSERDIARAAEQEAKGRLTEYRSIAAAQLADAKASGMKFAVLASGLGLLAGVLLSGAAIFLLR